MGVSTCLILLVIWCGETTYIVGYTYYHRLSVSIFCAFTPTTQQLVVASSSVALIIIWFASKFMSVFFFAESKGTAASIDTENRVQEEHGGDGPCEDRGAQGKVRAHGHNLHVPMPCKTSLRCCIYVCTYALRKEPPRMRSLSPNRRRHYPTWGHYVEHTDQCAYPPGLGSAIVPSIDSFECSSM